MTDVFRLDWKPDPGGRSNVSVAYKDEMMFVLTKHSNGQYELSPKPKSGTGFYKSETEAKLVADELAYEIDDLWDEHYSSKLSSRYEVVKSMRDYR